MPVAVRIAALVDDDAVVLAACGSQPASDHLPPQALGLRCSGDDDRADCRHVQAFAEAAVVGDDLEVSSRKVGKDAVAQRGVCGAVDVRRPQTSRLHRVVESLAVLHTRREYQRPQPRAARQHLLHRVAHDGAGLVACSGLRRGQLTACAATDAGEVWRLRAVDDWLHQMAGGDQPGDRLDFDQRIRETVPRAAGAS